MNRDTLLILGILGVLALGGAGLWFLMSDADDLDAVESTGFSIEDDAEGPRTAASRNRGEPLPSVPGRTGSGDAEAGDAVEAEGPPPAPDRSRLVGTVRDTEGAAVSGAVVSLMRDLSQIENSIVLGSTIATAVSDAEGRFALDDLVPDDFLLVSCDHEDFAPRRIPRVALMAGEVRRLEIVLAGGLPLEGVVVDFGGAPVEGAKVYVADPAARVGDPTRDFEATTTSGPDGRFRFPHLPQGYKRAWAKKSGYATAVNMSVYLREDQPAPELRFELEPGRRILGRVVDVEGRPVEGASVTASRIRGRDETRSVPPFPPVSTDASGIFEYDGLLDGAYALAARQDGYSSRGAATNARAGDLDVEIRLTPNPAIRGQVVDAETGLPVKRFSIMASASPDVAFAAPNLAQHFEDAGGAFSFAVSRNVGVIHLVVRAPGYAGGVSDPLRIDPRDGLDGVVLQAHRGVEVAGRVLDDARAPVPGVTVSLYSESATGGVQGPAARLFGTRVKRSRFRARTDADGRYVVRGVLPGRYRVRAEKEGWSDAESPAAREVGPEGGEMDDLVMVRPGRIAGRVRLEEGAPTAGVQVILTPFDGGAAMKSSVLPNGAFSLDAVPPGRYRIHVRRFAISAAGPEDGLEIQVQSGKELDLVLD